MSNHLSSEIPLRAFLNAGIIDRVVGTLAFEEAVREVMTLLGYGSYKYEFKNPAYILGMLYGLVVVPFERHFSDPLHTRKVTLSETPCRKAAAPRRRRSG
jgi:hypothetical protein